MFILKQLINFVLILCKPRLAVYGTQKKQKVVLASVLLYQMHNTEFQIEIYFVDCISDIHYEVKNQPPSCFDHFMHYSSSIWSPINDMQLFWGWLVLESLWLLFKWLVVFVVFVVFWLLLIMVVEFCQRSWPKPSARSR